MQPPVLPPDEVNRATFLPSESQATSQAAGFLPLRGAQAHPLCHPRGLPGWLPSLPRAELIFTGDFKSHLNAKINSKCSINVHRRLGTLVGPILPVTGEGDEKTLG